jgi:hypothetical protein
MVRYFQHPTAGAEFLQRAVMRQFVLQPRFPAQSRTFSVAPDYAELSGRLVKIIE